MRRRRNADASSTDVTTDTADTVETNVPDEATSATDAPGADAVNPVDAVNAADTESSFGNESETAPTPTETAALATEAADGAEPEKKPRRRTPRRKSTDTADEPAATPVTDAEPTVTTDSAPAEPAPAEKPKRAPRRRAAKATADAEVVAAAEPENEVVASPAPETPEMAVTEAPVAESLTPESLAPESPVDEEVPSVDTPEADDAPAIESSTEVEDGELLPAAETPSGERRSRRRRSSRRGGGNGAASTENAENGAVPAAAAAEAPIAEAVASTGDADEVDGPEPTSEPTKAAPSERSSRRNRGGRQRQSPSAQTPATPPVEDSGAPKRIRGLRRAPAPPVVFIPAPELAEIAPGEGDEETADRPKRIRGLRTRRVVPAATVAFIPTLVAEEEPQEQGPPPYQPLPNEVLARLPETKIVVSKGIAELVVNGAAQLPLWFFVNTEAAEDPEAGREIAVREIRMAYEAGIRFFTLLSHLPWKTRSGERRYDILDSVLQMVADNAPEAMVLPRLIFSPPLSWERAHPDEMTLYADGESGDISFASREFWDGEAKETLRAAVEHVAEGPHAPRVFGFYLEHAEWLYEKGRGYDISPANEAGFRTWLRQRYENNEVALRAAWHDGAVSFDTAQIPSYPPPSGSTLFFGPRETRWSDFHEYSSDVVAQTITGLGRAVKEASGGRSAVAVSYGYTLEINRAASGHFALGQVLDSSDIDILTGPISYSGRTPGGSATFPAPIDSVALAGKLWVSEDDSKTFRASGETPDTYNPKVGTLEATRSVQARNFGSALARGVGISWMDLWGEGWLDDPDIWQGIAYLRNVADAIAARRHSGDYAGLPSPDVAVVVDERSVFGVRSDEFLLGHLIAQQRDTLLRSGANVGFYLLSDLAKPDFPDSAKLILFLNAYRIPNNVRAVIRDRFQNDGRTLAWLYAPGVLETSEGAAAELSEVIGMQLRLQPWGSKAGTQAVPGPNSPLREALRAQKIGEEARFNPTYFAADPKAMAFGEYAATGNPSVAVRKHPRWQSVFIGEVASLTVPLLRGLYRLAGIPTLTVDDDAAWMGDNLLCLHSAPGGGTTVYLPEEGVLFDLLTGETLATDGFGARFAMPARGTRLLFFGSATDVARFGGDPNDGPPGLTREELPVLPTPFDFEAVPVTASATLTRPISVPAAPVAPDPADDALFTAALDAEFGALPTEDDESGSSVAAGAAAGSVAADPESEAARKKRRRRRRGRGRKGDQPDLLEGVELESGLEGDSELLTDDEDDAEAEDLESPDVPSVETTPGVMVFDVSTESFTASVPPGPQVRVRPSLEELLPLSDLPEGSELPPVPDELLPLPDGGLGLTGAAENEGDSPLDPGQETGRRTRRSRGGAGRYRRERLSAPTADVEDESPEASPEPGLAESGALNAAESTETAEIETDTSASDTEQPASPDEPLPSDSDADPDDPDESEIAARQ